MCPLQCLAFPSTETLNKGKHILSNSMYGLYKLHLHVASDYDVNQTLNGASGFSNTGFVMRCLSPSLPPSHPSSFCDAPFLLLRGRKHHELLFKKCLGTLLSYLVLARFPCATSATLTSREQYSDNSCVKKMHKFTRQNK